MFWGTNQERRAIDHFRYHQLQCAAEKKGKILDGKLVNNKNKRNMIQIRKITRESLKMSRQWVEKYPAIKDG